MPIGGASQEAWFRAVNHLARATPWLHTPARLFAQDGIVLFAALLLLSWWWARRAGDPRRVAAALWAPAGALVALGANQLLVAAFAEPRPFTVVPDALVLVSRSTDASFPSDHAVMAGAVAMGLALAHGRHALTWTGAGLAVLMAATRVYVGAHFPLDVVAGLLVGAAIALASYRLVRPVAVRLVEAVARTPVRALVHG
ncbi:phosphatase PAP2 family protein [Pimelobacter simplex]|uniref:phosphatase PAP2 family protein n=1 Tax=Nocardioides simplex TaxID=2045 RepID=UPI003AAD0CE7